MRTPQVEENTTDKVSDKVFRQALLTIAQKLQDQNVILEKIAASLKTLERVESQKDPSRVHFN